MEFIGFGAELPFVSTEAGRAVFTPDIASALFDGHGPDRGTFFLAAALPQLLDSLDVDIGTPLACGACWVSVDVDDVEEFEDKEDEELARWTLLRGMNILATSSAFIELIPP